VHVYSSPSSSHVAPLKQGLSTQSIMRLRQLNAGNHGGVQVHSCLSLSGMFTQVPPLKQQTPFLSQPWDRSEL